MGEVNWAKTPEGSRDRLFDECKSRRRCESAASDYLSRCGYSEVMTPALEYYDTLVRSGSPIKQQSMLKMSDRDGRIVVLRPDNTAPIARMSGARLRHMQPPHRLFYRQEVFRSDLTHRGRNSEIMQVGIELLGFGGLKADMEVIKLATGVLDACGIKEAHLEIGHAGFFNTLADRLCHEAAELNLEQPDISMLHGLIRHKNFAALDDALDAYKGCSSAESLRRLVLLFGKDEVFTDAAALKLPIQTVYLRKLYNYLADYSVSVDLGMVSPLDYYTGVMFEIYIPGAGTAVVSGGRYDNMHGLFGSDMPAAGFALDIDMLSERIPFLQTEKLTALVYCDIENMDAAISGIIEREQGSHALSPCNTWNETLELSRRLGLQKVVSLTKDGWKETAL